MTICGPDLDIPLQFIIYIFNLCEGKMSVFQENSNKHISHNLVYFAQKTLDLLKVKIFNKYEKNSLSSICNWMNETLVYLCEN
jgi:hypothetical protein